MCVHTCVCVCAWRSKVSFWCHFSGHYPLQIFWERETATLSLGPGPQQFGYADQPTSPKNPPVSSYPKPAPHLDFFHTASGDGTQIPVLTKHACTLLSHLSSSPSPIKWFMKHLLCAGFLSISNTARWNVRCFSPLLRLCTGVSCLLSTSGSRLNYPIPVHILLGVGKKLFEILGMGLGTHTFRVNILLLSFSLSPWNI